MLSIEKEIMEKTDYASVTTTFAAEDPTGATFK